MSKVSDAKAAQNFQLKPQHPRCADCQHFNLDVVRTPSRWVGGGDYISEKNIRCTLGGFKVGKNSVCDRFERKATVKP